MNRRPTTPDERQAAREQAAAQIVARNPKMKQAVEGHLKAPTYALLHEAEARLRQAE